MIVTGPRPFIAQTAGWVGIVDGTLLLVRTYEDGTLTAAAHDGDRWGPEVTLESAPGQGRAS